MIALAVGIALSIVQSVPGTTSPTTPTTEPATTAGPPLELTMAVSKTEGLDPEGETVTVTGSGYDEGRGIYVAFCVVPPVGLTPTPCGGGVDLEGSSGSSRWISSSPPDYGVGLAEPYGPGGSFTVTLDLNAMLRADIDCRQVQCAVVTRSDHTRLADRSLDVIVPVSFATGPVLTLPPLPEVEAAAIAPSPPVSATPTPTSSSSPSSSPSPSEIPTVAGAGATVNGATLTGDPTPVRGAAATWPVWLGTAVAVMALALAAPRRRRNREGQT